MAGKDQNVFMAKLAEQAERYEGKRIVFEPINRYFEHLQSRVGGLQSSWLSVDKHFFWQIFHELRSNRTVILTVICILKELPHLICPQNFVLQS